MTNGSIFREVCLSPVRSFHQMVISPKNSHQRSLLELFYPFQVEYLIKEKIETPSWHTTWIVCWSLFTLFKWNTWLKKKWIPICGIQPESWLKSIIRRQVAVSYLRSLFRSEWQMVVSSPRILSIPQLKFINLSITLPSNGPLSEKIPSEKFVENYHFCFSPHLR